MAVPQCVSQIRIRALRAKTATEQKLLQLIEPIAAQLGLVIIRIRLFGREKRKVLQIMAERITDQQMGIKDCTGLSRAISAVIDVEDPISGAYELEVSSPGIERPLTAIEDFERWAGHTAKLELDRLVEGRRRFKGVLGGLDGENIVIDLEGESESALMPFSWISDAHLVMSDALLKMNKDS
jgi:ribosome maturation factor RimP